MAPPMPLYCGFPRWLSSSRQGRFAAISLVEIPVAHARHKTKKKSSGNPWKPEANQESLSDLGHTDVLFQNGIASRLGESRSRAAERHRIRIRSHHPEEFWHPHFTSSHAL